MKLFILGAALFVSACAVLLAAIFVTYLLGAWLARAPVRRRRKRR